jgi:hypothetical protein
MSQRYQGGILGVGFNPLQAPNAPTIGTATAGTGQVSVAFTAPANVGGSAISSYRVLANPGGIGATTSSSPATVSGLTNGTTYTFSVAAVNSYGFSPYSGTATATPAALAIEDVFSTYLYTGNGSTQTITNGINLSGSGGLVWTKSRNDGSYWHSLADTTRGAGNILSTNATNAQFSQPLNISGFTSTGFTMGGSFSNTSGYTFASWTFREAPNFFDVVTYTGDGSNTRRISHNLGATPGFIVVKKTSAAQDWVCAHRYDNFGNDFKLNTTGTSFGGGFIDTPNATSFGVNAYGNPEDLNTNGATYVAYLWGHDTSSTGLIQCGSYSANAVVNLGWEPQWLMVKSTDSTSRYQGDWNIFDNMRGLTAGNGNDAVLWANSADAEFSGNGIEISATGFQGANWETAGNFIYIAIRRGPMRTPTLGTSVFSPQAVTLNSASNTVVSSDTAGPMDVVINQQRSASGGSGITQSRLTGGNYLRTSSTGAETSGSYTNWDRMTGTKPIPWTDGQSVAAWQFRRAPSFMDVVCLNSTTSAAQVIQHNLGVAPQIIISKRRNGTSPWQTMDATNYLRLNTDQADLGVPIYHTFTSTSFSIDAGACSSGENWVFYLFASCPGVSKVGTYTGTGALQTINCAFTTGARFVLIKRTDSTGDWYVWNSATGISSGNDPYLLLNTTDAEVTGTNYVDTDTTGFKVTAAAPAGINANGGTYIFLAIS